MAVCDMSKFPKMKYFQQHEIPEYGPAGFQYDYTRLLIIRAKATTGATDDLLTLNTIMEEYEDGGRPGIARTTKGWWPILKDYFGVGRRAGPRTRVPGHKKPFDFTLWDRSRVIIVIKGDFWKFAPQMAAVTTKHQYGSQYFDLRRHFVDENNQLQDIPESVWEHKYLGTKCNCVSFFSQDPCLTELNVTHGFSFNIDLVMDMTLPSGAKVPTTLPITIDPDIENKGGNPGP